MLDWLYTDFWTIQDANRYFYINNAFPGQLCFFVIGAYIYMQRERLFKINYFVLIGAFMIVILFLSKCMHKLTSPTFVTGIGTAALFILALKAPNWGSLFLKWIANISYSFYLLHYRICCLQIGMLSMPCAIVDTNAAHERNAAREYWRCLTRHLNTSCAPTVPWIYLVTVQRPVVKGEQKIMRQYFLQTKYLNN
jgi:hypothetical protein